jgi:hypothetical protein
VAWAHGGDDHADKAKATAINAAGLPRVEAHSDTFELVGRLDDASLTVFIDRYDSNEPVLGATLSVESGGVEADASFRAATGDYAVTDPRLLALLRQGDEHPLVFTIMLGAQGDLLDGKLRRPVMVGPAEHAVGLPWSAVLGGLVLAAVLAVGAYVYLRRSTRALRGLGEPV